MRRAASTASSEYGEQRVRMQPGDSSRGEGADVGRRVEELDWQRTPIGDVSLRRRREPVLDVDVFEVLLGEDYLMSSLFTVAEVALADLTLAAVVPAHGDGLQVVVGGLGLGFTAAAALADPRVGSLDVVDALDAVLGWHRDGLLPLGPVLTGDPRCRLVHGDVFAAYGPEPSRVPAVPERAHALLLDVDHSPRNLLHPSHASLYTTEGLARVAGRLHPGGAFGLWSDDPPDPGLVAGLQEVFADAQAHVVSFPNHLTGGTSANTVYVARS